MQGPNFAGIYAYMKDLLKKTSPDKDKNLELIAGVLGVSLEELDAILSRPHGLKSFLSHRLYFPANADLDHKMHVALRLGIILSDHLVKQRGRYEDVYAALSHYLRASARYREERDEDIQEENKFMPIIHEVLAHEMEIERKKGVKPDMLSPGEVSTLTRLQIEKAMNDAEKEYWIRIGSLTTGGLTREQAREKIYQDLLAKGDIEGAKMVRAFQDRVHPVTKSRPTAPPRSHPPPPPGQK